MPLIKTVLEEGIKAQLQIRFKSPSTISSLRKILDGGNGEISKSKSILDALENIKNITSTVNYGIADDPLSQSLASSYIQKVSSNEWSNALSNSISEWMSSEIAPIIAKVVSDQVDIYIKTGTVNVTVNGVTVGAPAPHAIIAQPGIGNII